MASTTSSKIFKVSIPLIKGMGGTFSKVDFEADLGEFIKSLLASNELAYLREEPAELIPAVEQASVAGIKEGVYTCLASQLECEVNSLPNRFEYHFGDFFVELDIVKPVESRLLIDPTVQRYLTWYGREDLEVNCSTIAWEINRNYRLHLMESRLPEAYREDTCA